MLAAGRLEMIVKEILSEIQPRILIQLEYLY